MTRTLASTLGNGDAPSSVSRFLDWRHGVVLALLVALYWRSVDEMQVVWGMLDSYYSHGFLVPLISAYFVWKDRAAIAAAAGKPCPWGYSLIVLAGFMLLLGDFLGFRVFGHLSVVPMLFGVCLVLWGSACAARLWFPIAFLLFMIPIPPSLTQDVALRLKLLAAECAVVVANWLTLPLVREGSLIHFGNDQLIIGEVCGGLRSLIALLAFGALMAYISKTRPWARVLMLAMSGPIAVLANVVRILLLCTVGYFWGSKVAAGKFHDISGILIFVVAFILFFCVEEVLRRTAPASPKGKEVSA